ncbi:MAG: bactofilin family protein [Candidatus Acidiferrales bacterium]
MWRKSAEVKPSSQPSDTPLTSRFDHGTPAPTPLQSPTTSQQASQITPQSTQPTSVVPATSAQTISRENIPSGASRIGAGLKIRGELSGKSDLYIDGEAQGKIRLAEARVTVGATGRVQADIEAREIVVNGTVEGNLKGLESVRLGPSSCVQGSVLTPRLAIDDGARLRGSVETIRPTDPRGSSAKAAAEVVDPDVLHPVHAHVESE